MFKIFISQYVECNAKLGGQPATPAHMGRRVGRAADPYKKQGRRRGAADPNGQKADEIAVRLGRPVGVALSLLKHARCSTRSTSAAFFIKRVN